MGGGDDWGDVRGAGRLSLGLEEVVTHWATDHTSPVLLHEDLTVYIYMQTETEVE